MSANRCDVCGAGLYYGDRKVVIGYKEYCGPPSLCHLTGKRSQSWRLSEQDAQALLDELFPPVEDVEDDDAA